MPALTDRTKAKMMARYLRKQVRLERRAPGRGHTERRIEISLMDVSDSGGCYVDYFYLEPGDSRVLLDALLRYAKGQA